VAPSSRSGLSKEANEKLRQKSVEIVKGELLPRSPIFPMPEKMPEL
jgi:hypothetical protein